MIMRLSQASSQIYQKKFVKIKVKMSKVYFVKKTSLIPAKVRVSYTLHMIPTYTLHFNPYVGSLFNAQMQKAN